jgi:hypothetical protein
VANIKFYNNSYSRSLNVSVEGMANGEFIVYDSEKGEKSSQTEEKMK